jgi:hypothetical protein
LFVNGNDLNGADLYAFDLAPYERGAMLYLVQSFNLPDASVIKVGFCRMLPDVLDISIEKHLVMCNAILH